MVGTDRKARKKLRRREQILEAAYQIFREVGYASATMDLIAERADLAKGTIYLYFKSKEDLYFSLLVNGLDILIRLLDTMASHRHAPHGVLKETARTLFHFYTEYTDYFRLFMVMQQEDMQAKLTPALSHELNARGTTILRVLSRQIQSLVDNGSMVSVSPWHVANILWGAFNGITQLTITKEHLNVRSPDIKELIYLFFDMIQQALASEKKMKQARTARQRH